jgi:sensor domain CHASE-containing protein
MTLRRKTLFVVSLTFLVLIAILYVTSQFLLIRSFDELEQQYTRREVERALAIIDADLSELDTMAGDWAGWNDTYAFIEDGNPQYIESNLIDDGLAMVRLNLIVYVHSSGRVVLGKAIDLQKSKSAPIPDSLRPYLSPETILLDHSDSTSGVNGLIDLPEGPLLIVARPILTSQKEGPSRGTLIMGRYLDSAEIERLARVARLSFTLHSASQSSGGPPDTPAVRSFLSDDGSVAVRPVSADIIAGYAMVKDIFGKSAFVLRVEQSRQIYRQRQASIRYVLGWIIMVTLSVTLVIQLLLDNLVLSRLARLNTYVSGIGRNKALPEPTKVTGNDELSNLATTINMMVESLNHSQQELRNAYQELETRVEQRTAELAAANEALRAEVAERMVAEEALRASEERFRSLVETTSDWVWEIDENGVYTYVSPKVIDLLGLRPEEMSGMNPVRSHACGGGGARKRIVHSPHGGPEALGQPGEHMLAQGRASRDARNQRSTHIRSQGRLQGLQGHRP